MKKLSLALPLLLLLAIPALPLYAQLEPPHVLIGQARVNGQLADQGAIVRAWDGTTKLGEAAVRAGGIFVLRVSKPQGEIVSFTVAGIPASGTLTTWRTGEIQRDFDLSASDQLVGEVPITALAAALGDVFVRVFTFDNATKEWIFYAPSAAEYSTLTTLTPGQPYLFLVSRDHSASMNGQFRQLTCRNGNCWNQVVW